MSHPLNLNTFPVTPQRVRSFPHLDMHLLEASCHGSIQNNALRAPHLVLFPVSLLTVTALIIALQATSLTAGIIPSMMMSTTDVTAATFGLPDLLGRQVQEPAMMTTIGEITTILPLIAGAVLTVISVPPMNMAIIVIHHSTGPGITATLVILIARNQMSGLRLQPLSADPHKQRFIVDLNPQSLTFCTKTHVSLQG